MEGIAGVEIEAPKRSSDLDPSHLHSPKFKF
jgi:hypothetical protein